MLASRLSDFTFGGFRSNGLQVIPVPSRKLFFTESAFSELDERNQRLCASRSEGVPVEDQKHPAGDERHPFVAVGERMPPCDAKSVSSRKKSQVERSPTKTRRIEHRPVFRS